MKTITTIKSKKLQDGYSVVRNKIDEEGKIYYLDRLYKNGNHIYKEYRYVKVPVEDILYEYLTKNKREIDIKAKEKLKIETYLNPKVSLDEKIEIIDEEVNNIFHQRLRWDIASFDDIDTRYQMADYDNYFGISFLSQVPNTEEMYIEYLKCYLKVLADPFFFDENIPDEYEFIKDKCEECGFIDSFESYYDKGNKL
jgi:hypothetical protein